LEVVFAPEVVLEAVFAPEVDEHKYADEQEEEEEEENMVEASGEVLPCTRPVFPDISSMAT
ncbi:hypothetical protein A2U01_0085896, partial [Trifolium medium]|nr:hypothetical protein [Trifolium medium]